MFTFSSPSPEALAPMFLLSWLRGLGYSDLGVPRRSTELISWPLRLPLSPSATRNQAEIKQLSPTKYVRTCIRLSTIFHKLVEQVVLIRLFLACPSSVIACRFDLHAAANDEPSLEVSTNTSTTFLACLRVHTVPLAGYRCSKQSLSDLPSSVSQSEIANYLSFSRNITLNTTDHHDERSHSPS